MRGALLNVSAIGFGLASFGVQAWTLLQSHTLEQRKILPLAWLFGAVWFALALRAWFTDGRHRWWTIAPAPLVLMTPLAVLWLMVACSVSYCDL
jgi:hypothetical protein